MVLTYHVRTDSELPKILNAFLYGDLAVFVGGDEKSGLLARASHFYRHGSVYNSRNLSRVMKINLGDITFKEAYLHSGRVSLHLDTITMTITAVLTHISSRF